MSKRSNTATKGKFAVALLVAACTGQIDELGSADGVGGGGGGGSGGEGSGSSSHPTVCEGEICIAASKLPRLTRAQFSYSVQQLLGAGVKVDLAQLPIDQRVAGLFSSNEASPVTAKDVDRYSAVAEKLSEQAPLVDVVPCEVASADASCVTAFVDSFVASAYRRPLSNIESSEYVALYDWAIGEGDSAEEAFRFLIATTLQSPHFLYRIERASEDKPTRLSGYEIATRLSYALWQEAPDNELLEAAAADALGTGEAIAAQARRMVLDKRFERVVRSFHREWLGLEGVDDLSPDESQFPDFTPQLAQSMRLAAEAFVVETFQQGKATQDALFDAPFVMVDQNLAPFYGVAAPSGAGFAKTPVDTRGGLLLEPAVMAVHSADSYTRPIFRGLVVRDRILCQTMKPRPSGIEQLVQETEKTLPKNLSDRERLDALTSGECAGCHEVMNGVGFAFNHFDEIGRYQATDSAGQKIDASATLGSFGSADLATDVDGDYTDAAAMSAAFATSDTVSHCLTRQWLRFALGRTDAPGDATSVTRSHETFSAADRDLRELIVAVVTSDSFRYRAVPGAP